MVDGDQIIFIIARDALKNGRLSGGVVGTQMSNLGLEIALDNLGIPFARSKVGDRYVMELLKEKGWHIGGENSGHVLNLSTISTGDGIVAGLQVLTAMLHTEKSLKSLLSGMTKFPQKLVNVRYEPCAIDYCADQRVLDAVTEAEQALGDTGRVLLRKSGTEPLIRVMVEAQSADDADKWSAHIAQVVTKIAVG